MKHNNGHYEQKIAYARASLWAPFYAVGMAARIHGAVPTDLLKAALQKLQTLYPTLASRVRLEQDGAAWLTTEGVGEFLLDVRNRTSDNDWIEVFLEQERIPFPFDCGPVARFFLLRGDQTSDLVAIVPHVISDGYSMTYVMCDLVALLNDPHREVTRPMPPTPVSWQNVVHSTSDNLILRVLARGFNHAYPGKRTVLDQNGYKQLHQRYWARQQNGVLAFAVTPAEVSDLSRRCRQHGISVTGALMAAFILAQADIKPSINSSRSEISVAVNIRDRMVQPPGRVIGVFASSIDMQLCSISGSSFWELARQAHAQIHKSINDRSQILMPLVLEDLDPTIADAFVAAVSTDEWSPELRLMTRFIKIKGEARCLNISNIGRIDLPELGNPYRLENILPFPPLVPGGRMTLNVLTVNGRMNLIMKFRQDELDSAIATQVRDRALSYLAEKQEVSVSEGYGLPAALQV
jgi:hypothetical protein